MERDRGEGLLLREWQQLSPAERVRRNERMLETERWGQSARPAEAEADARG
ncbi:MAG TPA: hypothetical protein VHN37_07700 [Actinomycetota bacterium]|nr:hypothetical protein [Actinomycetota bacterium]